MSTNHVFQIVGAWVGTIHYIQYIYVCVQNNYFLKKYKNFNYKMMKKLTKHEIAIT